MLEARIRQVFVIDDDPCSRAPYAVRSSRTWCAPQRNASEAEVALLDRNYTPDLVLCVRVPAWPQRRHAARFASRHDALNSAGASCS
jgi:hypothetical protein